MTTLQVEQAHDFRLGLEVEKKKDEPAIVKVWRMCIDFTNLNKACPKDPFPFMDSVLYIREEGNQKRKKTSSSFFYHLGAVRDESLMHGFA